MVRMEDVILDTDILIDFFVVRSRLAESSIKISVNSFIVGIPIGRDAPAPIRNITDSLVMDYLVTG
jgi:hypothetical protein